MMLSPLVTTLTAIPNLEIRTDEPLARHTSMGVGGPAAVLAMPHDESALLALLAALRGDPAATPWLMLGGGSNTLFGDEGFPGCVVMLGRGFRAIATGPGPHQVTCGAAANLSAVMNFCKRAALAGFEWAAGIPGQVGGALAGNAGTPAGDMCSDVLSVEVIDASGARLTRRQGEFDWSYRHSALRGDVILGCTLQLRPGDPAEIQAKIDIGLKKRGEQPIGVRTSGCMFKNPPGDHAGRLIDAAGLKGLRVGGAHVSDRHANFIINEGQATAGDILGLMEQIRARVKATSGVDLESEIRLFDQSK